MNRGQVVDNHFNRLVKMAKIGPNTVREVHDWKLACEECMANGFDIRVASGVNNLIK
ncbi:MAG: hypothetical protein Q8O66_00165 [bacterium]|nr:hypothetical protein [bacterium]